MEMQYMVWRLKLTEWRTIVVLVIWHCFHGVPCQKITMVHLNLSSKLCTKDCFWWSVFSGHGVELHY